MTADTPQRAIFDESARYHRFLEYRHQIQLERMFGVSGDGLHDRLIEFSRADTGSYLFAPRERALAEAIGS